MNLKILGSRQASILASYRNDNATCKLPISKYKCK